MAARSVANLNETWTAVRAASEPSAKSLCVITDVTVRAQVVALMTAAKGAFGKVDILVNCAGVMYFTLMKNALYDQWDQTIDVNCKVTHRGRSERTSGRRLPRPSRPPTGSAPASLPVATRR